MSPIRSNVLRVFPIGFLPVLLFNMLFAVEIPEFNEKSGWEYLLAQTNLGPRNPGSDGYYRALEYFVSTLQNHTSTVREQRFIHRYPYGDLEYEFTNIIARYSGQDSGKALLLGAHWDTRPWADQDMSYVNRQTPILGANDGASGVAVLLELSRLFSKNPPPVDVTIVLFDAEDMGRTDYIDQYAVGSKIFASRLVNPDRYRYAIVLDMVGDANLQLPMEGNSYRIAPAVTRRIWQLADSLGYDAFQQTVGAPIQDDHLMIFRHAGIPAVDIIDFQYPDRSHRYWHTLEDTPANCSPFSLKIVGDVLLHLIYQLKGSS